MPDSNKEATGRARGGKAKNALMTPEQRKEQGVKMARAKKELALLPKATHTGTLRLIDKDIPCAVLEDGTRVLTQSDFMDAMGMYYSGWVANNTPENPSGSSAEIPHFLAQKSLLPFVSKHLGHMQSIVLKYKTERGVLAHGIRAEIIPRICDIFLDAEKQGGLGKRQKQIADHAMLLMRALAHVGIIALVDEATGYQRDRARDALAKILEAYVAKELQPYVRTFEPVFYENMFRLRGLPYPPEKVSYRPSYFGHLTNDIVYSRLAPGVLKALKDEAKKEEKNTHLHRHLTPGYGRMELIKHLSLVVAYMRDAATWREFIAKMNKYAPRFNETLPLDLEEADR